MTATLRTTATKRVPMDSLRKTALVAGIFYLITFISIPTLALYGPSRTTGTGSSAPAATPPCWWAGCSR
jgi:hypothetical protein